MSKRFFRVVSLILISAMLGSCIHYTPFKTRKDPLPNFEGRVLRLIPEGRTSGRHYMADVMVQDDHLSGTILAFKGEPYRSERQLVNIYLDSSVALPDKVPVQFTFPLSGVKKIEVYDLDLGQLMFSAVLLASGVYAFAVLLIIMTKESCPFVYVYNGKDFEFTGEIYSGAIFPPLERDDYLDLPHIQPQDSWYQIRIANKVQEIQNTNLTELCVIDHPQNTEVLVDRRGDYLTVSNPQRPVWASSQYQTDILAMVTAKDSIKFLGDDAADKTQAKDAMFVSFDKPKNSETAKLVLRARNSFWLDYTLRQFFERFGDRYHNWYDKQSHASKERMTDFSRQQGITLSVYMKQDGDWKYVDYFDIVGPMADKDLIMPIDLTALDAGQIELKLECGALFWEIDYVAMDFTAQQKLYQQSVPLTSATDQNGKDVRGLLNRDDKKYFIQPKVGDEALLTFAVPKLREGCNRSVFLHSKGHYKIMINPKGTPDIAYLETFRQPERLGLFSRENYLNLKTLTAK